MNRKDTTAFLGQLFEKKRLSGVGKYWASEVSIDPWHAKGTPKRVDYMQFIPENQCSLSAIEKGIFVCYEIKSCKEDVYSGNGLNFLGEKNYIVTTMECYHSLLPDLQNGKLWKHVHKISPESSSHFGILVAVPECREVMAEWEDPTPITKESNCSDWKFSTILPCRQGPRKRSMTELLFCMLRSGK